MTPWWWESRWACRCRDRRYWKYGYARLPGPCPGCGAHFSPVNDIHHRLPSPWKARDETITPELAAEWLASSRSIEGTNVYGVVKLYADMMRRGEWTDMTLGRGGLRCAIVFDPDDRVRYGLQRLEACVWVDRPFRAAVVRIWRPELERMLAKLAA